MLIDINITDLCISQQVLDLRWSITNSNRRIFGTIPRQFKPIGPAAVQTILATSNNRSLRVPCVLMRGGTSRGPFFLEADLPSDLRERERFLIAALGSPHVLQVDGIGGGNPLTSKVAIVSASSPARSRRRLPLRAGRNRPSLRRLQPELRQHAFRRVALSRSRLGWCRFQIGETTVRIFNRNTSTTVEAVIQTPAGVVEYEGGTAIDGVPGTAAPVKLTFLDAVGSKTGAFLPTGTFASSSRTRRSRSSTTPCRWCCSGRPTWASPAMRPPMSSKRNLDLLARLEPIRLEAGLRMGLGDVSGSVVPKLAILSGARHGGTITSRYFMNAKRCHKGHAVTGALCIAAACRLPGSVAHDLATPSLTSLVHLEHPSGRTEIDLSFDASGRCLTGKPCPHRPQNLRGQRHRPGKRCRRASGRDTTRRKPCLRPSHADCSVAHFWRINDDGCAL